MMRGFTILQPYAQLIAAGAKRYETRSRATNYRGLIAIHAGKQFYPFGGGYTGDRFLNAVTDALGLHGVYDTETEKDVLRRVEDATPLGAIVAVAELTQCWKIEGHWAMDSIEKRPYANILLNDGAPFRTLRDPEIMFGDYRAGRYAYELANVRKLTEPLSYRGQQGFWTIPPGVEAEIMRRIIQ
jgi:hypothetical protein